MDLFRDQLPKASVAPHGPLSVVPVGHASVALPMSRCRIGHSPDPWQHRRPTETPQYCPHGRPAGIPCLWCLDINDGPLPESALWPDWEPPRRKPGVPRSVLVWVVLAVVALGLAGVVVAVKW